MIQDAHDIEHYGVQALFVRIWHKGYWWSNIRKDIQEVTGSCLPCLRYTSKKTGYHPLKSIESINAGEHWAIVLIAMPGGFILNIVDIATRLAVLKALDSKKQEVVAWALWEVMCLLGPHKNLQSDNGKEFVNTVMKALLKRLGTAHRAVASYHPRANGSVERVNAEVESIIKKMCESHITQWRQYLPFAMLAYNSRVSTRTQSMPFALMFGREPTAFESYAVTKMFPVISPSELLQHWENVKGNVLPAVYEGASERRYRTL